MNPVAESLLGQSRKTLTGRTLRSVWKELIESDQEVLAGQDGKVIERYVRRLPGYRELYVLRDITERRHLEEQLRHSQKMEAIGRLAGGVAHDFNNMLAIITGYGQMLLDELAPGDPLHAEAGEILRAGNRAAALTSQLLAFSRRQMIQPQVLDLSWLITRLEKMLRPLVGEHIELNLLLSPELGPIEADPAQIEQVIMNLAANARDAMPQGGPAHPRGRQR